MVGLFGFGEHFFELADEDLVVHEVVDFLAHAVVFGEVGRVGDFAEESFDRKGTEFGLGLGKGVGFDGSFGVLIVESVGREVLLESGFEEGEELLGGFVGDLGEEFGTEGLEGFLEVVLLEVLFERFEAVEHLLVVGKY